MCVYAYTHVHVCAGVVVNKYFHNSKIIVGSAQESYVDLISGA